MWRICTALLDKKTVEKFEFVAPAEVSAHAAIYAVSGWRSQQAYRVLATAIGADRVPTIFGGPAALNSDFSQNDVV